MQIGLAIGTAALGGAGAGRAAGRVASAELATTEGAAEQFLFRARNGAETVKRLTKLATDAERQMGHHGVSTFDSLKALEARFGGKVEHCGVACREVVEKFFRIDKTGGPGHWTIVLPKPITPEVAKAFNSLFKQIF